jgi:LacI family transcriptional regulator
VSRVFSGASKVSDAVKQRVHDAALSLDWIPNAAGRALASSRTYIAGAIIPTLDNEIFARQVSGLQGVLSRHGITLFLGCSNYDPDQSLLQARAMLARGVEALAIVGEDHPPELFAALRAQRVPYVVTYSFRQDSSHPCIGFDNSAAFAAITGHLLSLGHRRFAVIVQPTHHNRRVTDRLAGIHAALAAAGLTIGDNALQIGPSGLEFGALAFERLMQADKACRPTAIICGNDMLALGALGSAARLGLVAPRDFSITGFDDLAISSRIEPHLTTMWVDNFKIGEVAAQHLLDVLVEQKTPAGQEITPVIRLRSSSGLAP